MFWKSVYNEFLKIAAKPRSYIGFGVITLIVSIILISLLADGTYFISFATKPFEQSLTFEGKILNGNLVTFIILQMLILQIPILIAFVTGDLISGEAAMGSIRLLLTKPVSRTQILFSKYIAGCAYTFSLLLWLMLLAFVFGRILFGSGDLMVLSKDALIVLQEKDLFWRFICAFGVAYLSMIMITTLSLMLSCFSENSIGPIVSTMGLIILFSIIGALDLPIIHKIQPYLFTSHMITWRHFFEDPVPVSKIINSVEVLSVHIVGLLIIAVYQFNKKDILS